MRTIYKLETYYRAELSIINAANYMKLRDFNAGLQGKLGDMENNWWVRRAGEMQ